MAMVKTENDRFWSKVRKTRSCWLWIGKRTRGYGRFQAASPRGDERAHRAAWRLAHGNVPDGLCVLHHCDNRPCVKTEPDGKYPDGHLFLGTHADNANDRNSKGRQSRGSAHYCAALTESSVRRIREAWRNGSSCAGLARKYGVDPSTVWNVVVKRTWRHVV
jgi:hypothetical protein